MTLFLSDLHLGNPKCKADELLSFLDSCQDDDVFLVGDIFDDIMRVWPQSHLDVVRRLLSFERIVYLPGNHDAGFRSAPILTDRFLILDECRYEASNGLKYLIVHGDRYDLAMWLGNGPKWLRRLITSYRRDVHSRIMTSRIEKGAIADVKSLGFDGIICGHTHSPVHKLINDIDYVNCGDWLWHKTAVVDRGDGLKLIEASNELSAQDA